MVTMFGYFIAKPELNYLIALFQTITQRSNGSKYFCITNFR